MRWASAVQVRRKERTVFDVLVSVNKIFIFIIFIFLNKISMPPTSGSLASSEIPGAFGTTAALPCLCFFLDFFFFTPPISFFC